MQNGSASGRAADDGGRRGLVEVPDRLRVLVEKDREAPVQQPTVAVDYERWCRRLVAHEQVVRALPAKLDRASVRDFVLNCGNGPDGAVRAFIATQIWGYGTTGYGPFRLREALSHSDLPLALVQAKERLCLGEPVEAFRALCVDQKIPWTGTSFGTKYLYFTDPLGKALILDRIVAGWLQTHAGLVVRGQRDAQHYANWLVHAESWAQELRLTPDRVEMLIFTDGLGEDSSWRPAAAAGRPSSTRRGRTCAEAIAEVIADTGRAMRASEIAGEINRRGSYVRADGQPLPAYQVSSIAHGSLRRFKIVDGLIALQQGTAVAEQRATPAPSTPAGDPVCVLIGCVSRKEPTARPAKDLYRTELFSRRRAYAERSGYPWLIVSALFGAIAPDDVIEPYDRRVSDLDRSERRELAERIADQLEQRFGELQGTTIEVHAGDEYMTMLGAGLLPRGAQLVNPLRGLRIGEQLAWYGKHSPTADPRPTRVAPAKPNIAMERMATADAAGASTALRYPGLAKQITAAFQAGELNLCARPAAPTAGWAGMPEVAVAQRMRQAGASDHQVRLLLTFTAAMDRARDADALWFNALRLFEAEPWAFSPREVVARSLTRLADTLRGFRVSQRHGPDAAAWRVIGESLHDAASVPAVFRAIHDGEGNAPELLQAIQAASEGGTDQFPFLRGPKVGPMWVRMLAYPGGATISSLETVPVAVDVQVRKLTEYLGVTDTGNTDLDIARPLIQAAWALDVRAEGTHGPPGLDDTAAALDPALWFWAKWGCTHCERRGRPEPIAAPCQHCRFPRRT